MKWERCVLFVVVMLCFGQLNGVKKGLAGIVNNSSTPAALMCSKLELVSKLLLEPGDAFDPLGVHAKKPLEFTQKREPGDGFNHEEQKRQVLIYANYRLYTLVQEQEKDEDGGEWIIYAEPDASGGFEVPMVPPSYTESQEQLVPIPEPRYVTLVIQDDGFFLRALENQNEQ